MAATRLIPLHENKGKTVSRCLKDRTDYVKNGEKTNDGEFISSYECNPEIVDQEFYSTRQEYLRQHRETKHDVIAYQIRQSFKPVEITPEEANAIGYELAMKFTKGQHAFIVATHTDKAHIHNHIVYNSTNLSGNRKFRNFFLSSFVIQKISDELCLEHGLSVIKPKPYSEREK
ncbi:MAG: relaxase/mobilization nuclease domain-containing protein, partial [Lachnospiraceae bacterium]|nr:relaxase/mobilization nuclease domain-containing protein [Lachnospiraceae bacterium]